MQIDVGSEDDRQTLRRKERVGRSKLIQTNLTEPNIRRTFHDLYSISLLRLMKSSTFSVGPTLNNLATWRNR